MREIDMEFERLNKFLGLDPGLTEALQNSKPWAEKLKNVYDSIKATPDSNTLNAISIAALHMKITAMANSMNAADNELDGCVWRLFDLIVKGNESTEGKIYTIENVLSDHMDKFFDDEEMFWEAYKTLVILDVIPPSYILNFTSVGMYIKGLQFYDDKEV